MPLRRVLPLRHFARDVRLLTLARVGFGALETSVVLFGALFLLHAGGGLVALALWMLPLAVVLPITFLAAAAVMPRLGTRAFALGAVGLQLATALALLLAGERASEPAWTLLIALLRAGAVGLHYPAVLVLEYDLLRPDERPHYFSVLNRLILVASVITPPAIGALVWFFPAGVTAGYLAFFSLVVLVAVPVLVLTAFVPDRHTPSEERFALRSTLATPGWKSTLAYCGLWEFAATLPAWIMPLVLAVLLHSEASIGAYQGAGFALTFGGWLLSAAIIHRLGLLRTLHVATGLLGARVLALALFFSAPALVVLLPLQALAAPALGSAYSLLPMAIIDRDPQGERRRYLYFLGRELVLAGARLASGLTILVAGLGWGESALRPLLALSALVIPPALFCLARGLARSHAPGLVVPLRTTAPAPDLRDAA